MSREMGADRNTTRGVFVLGEIGGQGQEQFSPSLGGFGWDTEEYSRLLACSEQGDDALAKAL